MTYMDLINELETTGMPVTYGSFKSNVSPPLITVNFVNNADLMADNINYKSIDNFQVELYTSKKHPPTEQKVEDKLISLGIGYQKLEFTLEKGSLRQIVYEIQLI